MKKFVSIFLVLVALLSFSVTTFASEGYIPKTVELVYDPATYTYSVPNGVDIYVGDTIVFDYLKCNIVASTEYADECITIFPGDCAIYIDGFEAGGFWYSGTVVFNTELFKALDNVYTSFHSSLLDSSGHVSISVKQWHCDSKTGDEEFINPAKLPYPTIIEFDLKDPSKRAESNLFSFFSGSLEMTSELVKTIVRYPLILCFVVLSLVGLGIGIFVS